MKKPTNKIYTLAAIAAFVVLGGASCISFNQAGQGLTGIFRSDDKGEGWRPVDALPTIEGVKSLSQIKTYNLFRDPSDVNALYLGTRGQGLYYSYNNGNTWQVAPAMNGRFIYALAVDPKDKCTIYVSDGPHIYKTVDCMRTWDIVFTEERTAERLVDLAVDPFNSNKIFGLLVGGDVLVSDDAGGDWRIAKRLKHRSVSMVLDPKKEGRIYVATHREGLYRSDDSGKNWTHLKAALEKFNDSMQFYRLRLNPAQEDSLFWISKYGILRSDNAGAVWQEVRLLTPPGSVNIFSFDINPQNQNEMYYTGTLLNSDQQNERSTFYKTTDGGKNWVTRKLPTDTIPVTMIVHHKHDNVIFLGFTETN